MKNGFGLLIVNEFLPVVFFSFTENV